VLATVCHILPSSVGLVSVTVAWYNHGSSQMDIPWCAREASVPVSRRLGEEVTHLTASLNTQLH
jgi:hypothetical protein